MEDYLSSLNDELNHAKLRLQLSEKEGQKIIKQQIREIKRDIQRISMKMECN